MRAPIPIQLPARPRRVRDDLGAALARRIGPMFGVFDSDSPHGRSWVVDVSQVSTRELSQGYPDYPNPSPEDRSEEAVRYRALFSAMQNGSGDEKALSPTTIGKFGPSTRAALILVASNSLLSEAERAIEEVLQLHLSRFSSEENDDEWLATQLLVLWAVAVGEVWVSHPALLWAAIWARTSQRSINGVIRDSPTATSLPAESETGYAEPRKWDYAPDSLAIIDGALEFIRRGRRLNGDAQRPISVNAARLLRGADETLCSVIAQIHRLDGKHPAITWVPPVARQEERVATAYAVPIAIIKEFAKERNISPFAATGLWPEQADDYDAHFVQAAEKLSAKAFGIYVRTIEVSAEWASRGSEPHWQSRSEARAWISEGNIPANSEPDEKGSHAAKKWAFISARDHAKLQRSLACAAARYPEIARAVQANLLHSRIGEADDTARVFESIDDYEDWAQQLIQVAELRAVACELREARLRCEPKDRQEESIGADMRDMEEAAARLVLKLDQLALLVEVRRIATGPGLAQMSRATSDLFDALEVARGQQGFERGFWDGIHGKIGGYWDTYTRLLDESSPSGADNAVDHYLGNLAGYLAATGLAPAGTNPAPLLKQAFRLFETRIIPYREKQFRSRAEWATSWIYAVKSGVKCAIELVGVLGTQQGVTGDYRNVYLQQAAGWLTAGAKLLPLDGDSDIERELGDIARDVRACEEATEAPLGLADEHKDIFAKLLTLTPLSANPF